MAAVLCVASGKISELTALKCMKLLVKVWQPIHLFLSEVVQETVRIFLLDSCILCELLFCKYIYYRYDLYPQAGADFNSANPETPLVIATNKDLSECVKYLLEVGADANIPSNHVSSQLLLIAAVS